MTTRPSIPAVVTLPERSCSRCGKPLLKNAPSCSLCGTPAELSVAAQIAAFRDQLQAEGRCGPRKPQPEPESLEQKRARWMRGEDVPGEALYPPSQSDETEV
jgi:predicted amidophosphoribosyltransferase